MFHRAYVNFHDERIGAGPAMALHHLGRAFDYAHDFRKHVTYNRHADKSGNRHAEPNRIDVSVEAADDSRFLHTPYTFHYGRGCEPDATAKLRIRKPSIELEFLKQFPANLIKQLCAFKAGVHIVTYSIKRDT